MAGRQEDGKRVLGVGVLVCIPLHLRFYHSVPHVQKCTPGYRKFPVLDNMGNRSNRQYVRDLREMAGREFVRVSYLWGIEKEGENVHHPLILSNVRGQPDQVKYGGE